MDAEISAGSFGQCPATGKSFPGGGGGAPLQEANGDVPLDGVAFSIELLEWDRKFWDFWGSRDSKWEDSWLKKSESCCLLNLTITLH